MDSGYNMRGGGQGGSSEQESNAGLQSLLAQLQRSSTQENNPSVSSQNFNTQQHQQHHLQHQQPHQQQQHAQAQFSAFNQQPQPPFYPGQQHHRQYPQQQQHHEQYVSPVDEDNYDNNSMPAAPSPPVAGFPNAQFPPGILGSIGTGRPGPNQPGTSSQLLNLLKFSGPGSQPAAGHASVPQETAARDLEARHHSVPSAAPALIHAPAPVSSDPTGLLAALMQGHLKDEAAAKAEAESPARSDAWASTSQSNDTQQYLLNLLNRPKPSQNEVQTYQQDSPLSHTADRTHDKPVAPISPDGPLGGHETGSMPTVPTSKSFDFESPKPASSYEFESKKSASEETAPSKASLFTYNNPFDDLAASSPLNRTPKSSTTPGTASASHTAAIPIQILKKPGSSQSNNTQEGKRRRLDDPAGPSYEAADPADDEEDFGAAAGVAGKHKETVSDAVLDLADKADKEAQEALARAEEEQAQASIAKEMNDLLEAKTEEEFQAAAQSTGRAIKNELEKDENKDVLESTLPPEMAQAVRQIVDEAANGVADSWESADAEGEEKVIVEEATVPPVRVYNFPMKPWISIHVQDVGKEDRSLFREEAILDIARLKKDFDQIDRNLVTACETYMAFGMSKNGGVRIIRQSDGRDFKLFTSTKDRIFNVAMSHATGQDTEGEPIIPKTSLLATGISGTVYWVQIRVGDKDTLEDANPEQCGFALPPITAHESDAPGGVLKTRARTSSSHPEFFAVGRGKSINFIWPGLIMEQQPFKPGHDRVVDTAKLVGQCSLKINTGKAGKDFTFSLDDTVVVSLDKSGRVKFWDVRDLTAVKEGCDPRNPVPAQASLEVKEPLWTLTTTPEGEKAWPTSVLLLDKARPYQKRTAMRYMVIGMKQNHTLQLWDLALGKPVQEFNLPHSKESDAVCSIMYHPPTGMLVVGHPTRNSIFFLHVSAPKYNLKGLSQVDYIQRLRAQDTSVPQPESTAVISGIREYSFENRGTLRSLDMVPQTQGEDQLFELYAMHSKGVACITVKQAELGWTKDNKVITPVDAIESGMVVIDKLKTPLQQTPQLEPLVPVPASSHSPAPRILPSRAKENKSQSIANHDDVQDGPELAVASKPKMDVSKEDGAPSVQPATPAAEKPEKRGRKKKAAAAAVAAAAQAERENVGLSNGSSNSSHLSPNKPAESSKTPQMPNSVTQEEFDSRINSMETRICERVAGTVHVAFDAQKKELDSQIRARDLDFERKQGRLIDMVSEVLNTNTQKVLGKIVLDQFDQAVMPAIRQDVAKSISEQLSTKLNNQIQNVLQREVQKSMSSVLGPSLKALDLPASISAKVSHTVATSIEQQLGSQLSEELIPAVTSITNQAAQRVAHDVYQQTADHINRLEQQQHVQNAKMDSLVELVSRLSDTVATLAGAQAQSHSEMIKFQTQVLQHQAAQPVPQTFLHRQFGDSTNASLHSPATTRLSQPQPTQQSPRSQQSHHSYEQQVVFQPKSREDRERYEFEQLAEQIDDLLKEGRNDLAMMRWLQSQGREQDLFKRVLSHYPPSILQNLQPLVLLTVGTTVSMELTDSFIVARLQWLEAVILGFFSTISNLDDQTREITPKTMGNIKQRLENVFMHISSMKPNDPSLKNVAQMTTIIGRIIDMTRPQNPYQ